LPQYVKIQAEHDCKVFQNLLKRVRPYVCDIEKKNILDVGCGKRAPSTLLFSSLGAKAVGIDIDLDRGFDFAKYWQILAARGYKAVLSRFIDDGCNSIYYRELKKVAGFPLNFEGVDLRETDACQTNFDGEQFDLIVSNAAFEHFKDVSAVLKEMKRIMKQDAIIHVEIHLFPSLTGGHNILWSDPDNQRVLLGKVQPWDHLRKQKNKVNIFLNKLRERDYHKLFSNTFEILEWINEYWEPDHFLTRELSLELSDYSREELLKRAIVVIARKSRNHANICNKHENGFP
jgi:ubiquinone/menaquinone biosynthesis C-methylase UbiE